MSDLPQGWAETTLGEIVTWRKDKVDPANVPEKPFIGLEDIEPHTSVILRIGLASEVKSSVACFEAGDVLYSRLRPYLNKVARPDFSGVASAEILALKPSDAAEAEFVRRKIMTREFLDFTAMLDKGDRPRVSYDEISNFRVSLPPFAEQQRIVAKIDSLAGKSRRAGDHLDHIPRLVEKYKQAILDAAFDGRLTKLKSHQLTFVELGALLQFGPQNGLYLPKDRYGSGVPILRIQNYGLDSVDPIDTWSRVNVSEKMAGQYSLYCGDLVINRVNSPSHLGKSMVVVADMGGALFESNMMRMRLRPGVEPRFVQLYLSSPKGRAALTEGAKWAVNQASINQGDVTGTLLPIPDHDAQIEIVQRIRQAFAWINLLATATTSARKLIDHLDQAVLAKAFKGELLPQDLADEPASVLLDRIRAERAAAPKAKRSRKKTA